MKHWNLKRVLSLLLVVCMVTGLLSGVSAMAEDQTANYHEISTDGLTLATEDNAAADETETEEAPYADTDVVRVFVVLEDKPVLQQGYATRGIAGNAAAMAASKALEAKQAALAAEISAERAVRRDAERSLEPDAGRQRHVRRPALWQDGRGRSAEGR